MSHTVLLENPERAHLSPSSGVFPTSRSAPQNATPTNPTTTPGSGSRISAATTITNAAK